MLLRVERGVLVHFGNNIRLALQDILERRVCGGGRRKQLEVTAELRVAERSAQAVQAQPNLLSQKSKTAVTVPANLSSNCFFCVCAADEGASRPSSPLSPPHQPLNGSVEVLPSPRGSTNDGATRTRPFAPPKAFSS